MEDKSDFGEAGKLPLHYKALIAAVIVITIAGVWLVPTEEQPAAPPLPDLPSLQEDADLQQAGNESIVRTGEWARAFIAALRDEGPESDPQIVFIEAKRLQEAGYFTDAYMLYRYAARHGHGQAALKLGSQADKAFHAEADADMQSDEPEQAYKWYSMAVDAGNEEAVARLQALRKRVEQSAAGGDDRARRLMLQWK